MMDPTSDLMRILNEMQQDPMIRGLFWDPNHTTTIDRMITCIRTINIGIREYQDTIRNYEDRYLQLIDRITELQYQLQFYKDKEKENK